MRLPRSVAFVATGIGLTLLVGLHQFRVLLFQENLHTVVPGEVYRSAQPPPHALAGWIESLGLRCIVNLRAASANKPEFEEEVRIAREAGAELEFVRMSARRWPTRDELVHLIDTLDTTPRPVLLHCRSGADRAGLASAVVRLLNGDTPEQATEQFSWRFGYLGETMGSPLPNVLSAYREWLDEGEQEHSPDQFREWARNHYAPAE